MYKFPSKQIGMSDFGMSVGLSLSAENRWVRKAAVIPWDEIEKRYAALFKSKKGNVAKSLRLALGALIIQTEYQYPDVEVPLQIQETPCLQYFCSFPEYKDEMPFDLSLMVYFRKRMKPEILGEINELIIEASGKKAKTTVDGGDDGDGPPNAGTLIVGRGT